MNQQSLEEAVKVNCTTTLFFARIGCVTKEELQKFCQQFGPIKDISLMFDPETQKPKGCAFVKFMKYENANRCIIEGNQMNKNDSVRKNWVIEWAKSSQIKEKDLDKTTIYISNLNEKTNTEEMLREKFGVHGTIERLTIVNNANSHFAFVKFEKIESAVNAINNENGKKWEGTNIVVEFSEAIESKRNRRYNATMKKRSSQNSPQPQSPKSGKVEVKTPVRRYYHRSVKSASETVHNEVIAEQQRQKKKQLPHESSSLSHSPSPSRYPQTMIQRDEKQSPFDSLVTVDDSSVSLPIFSKLYTPHD